MVGRVSLVRLHCADGHAITAADWALESSGFDAGTGRWDNGTLRRRASMAESGPVVNDSPLSSRHGGDRPSRLRAKKTQPIQCLHQSLQGIRRWVPILAHHAGHDGLA